MNMGVEGARPQGMGTLVRSRNLTCQEKENIILFRFNINLIDDNLLHESSNYITNYYNSTQNSVW